MRWTPSIPELAQRDRFIKRVIEQRAVFAVSDDNGLAQVASQRRKGFDVTLLWSREAEAERWADALAEIPQVKRLTLAELLAGILIPIPEQKRFVGLDWNANPVEGEFNPLDIADKMRTQAIEGFVQRVRTAEQVFILEDRAGPAMMKCCGDGKRQFMPVWSDRSDAQSCINGPWSKMIALEIPLSNFLGLTLPWLAEHGYDVGPDYAINAGTLELAPKYLASRLNNRAAAAA